MGNIDSATAKSLDAIRQLAAQWHMELAEERVHALLKALPESAIKDVLPVLRDLACLFHKQRRRRIEEHIAARAEPSLGGPPASAGAIVDVLEEAKLFARELNTGFRDLADRHIFQWATFYREFVNRAFDRAMSMSRGPAEATRVLRAAFATHTAEVFYKGYQYNMENTFGRQLGLTKTLNGLQRFLELPIERYSADAPHTGPGLDAALLRRTCSSMLAGILEGFGTVRFGPTQGWQLLPRYPRSWVHYAGLSSLRGSRISFNTD